MLVVGIRDVRFNLCLFCNLDIRKDINIQGPEPMLIYQLL